MNELMTALEAMITRVVQTELQAKQLTVPSYTEDAFKQGLRSYVTSNKAEFAALVSVGALDMPWFDDAVRTEVTEACATIAPAQGIVFASMNEFNDAVVNTVEHNSMIRDRITSLSGYRFTTKGEFQREVYATVQDSDTLSDWFRAKFDDCISNVSFSTTAD